MLAKTWDAMDDAESVFKRALDLQERADWVKAEALYRALLAERPGLGAVINNLAVCLLETDRADEALDLLASLVGPEAKTNLGNALRALGRFAEAESAYNAAVAAAPLDARALSNLALVHQDQGRLEESVAGFEKAVAVAPYDASLRANLGGALLMAGDYRRGFPAYEFRLAGSATEAMMKRTGLPIWDGTPLQGRRLLVWSEQGLGDALQFLRFISLLGEPAAVMAQAGLRRLLQQVPGIKSAHGWDETPPDCDVQAALLSLPRLLGCDEERQVPAPNLVADPLLVDLWGQRLDGLTGLKVGLSWQGNAAMKADRARSIPLDAFKPLLALPGISWVSLQTGSARQDIEKIQAPLLDLGAEISDLADTAAIMAHLDLVIAVDSAVAHLAGSLNRPVWILVRANPDWRWRPGAKNSPWYPTARLWRQEFLFDWTPVISSLAAALATSASGPR